MSVTETTIKTAGQTGLRNDEGNREYTVVWTVKTDDRSDGPQVVLDNFGGASPGDTYSIGNDVDTTVTLKSLVPRRVGDTGLQWEVTGKYTTPGGTESGQDENGDPTNDPLQFHTDVQIDFAQFQTPVEKAIFRGVQPGAADVFSPRGDVLMGKGIEIPVTNTALVRFVPGETKDDSRMVIRITKNLQDFPIDQSEEYKDAVNADAFNVTLSPRQTKNFAKETVKVGNIGGQYTLTNGIFYWPVTYELHVNPKGWNRELVDRGVEARAMLGDADGQGGEITALAAGEPPVRRLKDKQGIAISDPIRFDGNGQPQDPALAAKFVEYELYDLLPFSALGL